MQNLTCASFPRSSVDEEIEFLFVGPLCDCEARRARPLRHLDLRYIALLEVRGRWCRDFREVANCNYSMVCLSVSVYNVSWVLREETMECLVGHDAVRCASGWIRGAVMTERHQWSRAKDCVFFKSRKGGHLKQFGNVAWMLSFVQILFLPAVLWCHSMILR